jgi:alpha-tubulin suppressor-like RCC1 family protein
VKLLSRGTGLYGALGTGNLLDSTPFTVIDTKGMIPVKVSAGWGHSVVLTSCGHILICGRPYDFSILLRLNAFPSGHSINDYIKVIFRQCKKYIAIPLFYLFYPT